MAVASFHVSAPTNCNSLTIELKSFNQYRNNPSHHLYLPVKSESVVSQENNIFMSHLIHIR